MLHSMTGFGSASGQVGGVEYAVEVRAVNNRYFKANIKTPEGLSWAEPEIDKLLRRAVSRGTVNVLAAMKVPDEQAAYRVNTVALGNYIAQLRPLEVDANPTLRIDLGSLMQLPGVCQPPALESVLQQTRDGLMELVKGAIDGMIEMRRREGEAAATELTAHCKAILEHLETVEQRAPQVVVDYHERLAARVQELTAAAKAPVSAEDLAREVAVFAERCDVAEEIARLRGHVEQFTQALAAREPIGRKLEFIAQEMLREANTIASKANDLAIGRAVVEVKTAIDRIKEQVQNIE